MRKITHCFSPLLLAALCDVARGADQLVDLILDGKPGGAVLRELLRDLDRVDEHQCGGLGETAIDLLESGVDSVELRDGSIWVYAESEFDDEEEETCPAPK